MIYIIFTKVQKAHSFRLQLRRQPKNPAKTKMQNNGAEVFPRYISDKKLTHLETQCTIVFLGNRGWL